MLALNKCQLQMKSIFRLYVNTSKGNDQFLYRQLLQFRLKPKFQQHLKSFYFDASFQNLIDLSHRSLIAQNLFLQIGQPFPVVDQVLLARKIQNLQFKNYLPIKNGLIQNITLNIIMRQSSELVSQRVMQTIIKEAIHKQIVKSTYFKEITTQSQPKLPYQQMKQFVERKWQRQEELNQSGKNALEGINENRLIQNIRNLQSKKTISQYPQSSKLEQEISSPFNPNLTLYVLHNKGRILLKVNNQEMYKFGWKKQVGWAPIRQTIVASVLQQSKILQNSNEMVLWDPFCGSGTIPLVALAIHFRKLLRIDAQKHFNWPFWPIYKPQYLQQYMNRQQSKSSQASLKIVCNDIDFKAANYTLSNLKIFSNQLNLDISSQRKVIIKSKPTEQWTQLFDGLWNVGCGDFEELSNSVFKDNHVTIVTNLPYIHGRSAQQMPLSQLQSVYRRFNQMIVKNQAKIDNIFIIIDANTSSVNHFLSISKEKWFQVESYSSGGRPISMYAWSQNKIKINELTQHQSSIALQNNNQDLQKDEVKQQIQLYKARVSIIDKKQYRLPEYLKKIYKRGWKKILQKRRQRHLLAAYEIFSKKRDKLIALTSYYNKKSKIKMIERGVAWRKRNTKLLHQKDSLLKLQKPLRAQFQGRISDALKREEEYKKKIEIRQQQQQQLVKQIKNKSSKPMRHRRS